MTQRSMFAILALLSQTGCVAAIPLATQLVSGANSTTQLCSMAKVPGQTASLCDHLPFASPVGSPAQPGQAPAHGTIVNAAAK